LIEIKARRFRPRKAAILSFQWRTAMTATEIFFLTLVVFGATGFAGVLAYYSRGY
jgi:hypothetical protein